MVEGTSSTEESGPGTGGLITSDNFSTIVGSLKPAASGNELPPSEAYP